MFRQLREAIDRLGGVVAQLDPACLDGTAARRLVEEFARAERLATAGKAVAARRVAETGAWSRGGAYRDAATWMAATTGTPVGQARATLETARHLESLPRTEAALRAGALSSAQVNEIAAAASVDPDAERGLLAHARTDGIKGLKERCARVRAAAARDETDRYEQIRLRRSLRHWRDSDGAGRIDIRGPADATAAVLAALEPFEADVFRAARDAGRREPPDALAFDALVALSASGHAGGPNVRPRPVGSVVVRVDHAAFVRGHTEAGETCEIAGVGPVPVAVAQRMACDAFLKVLVTDGNDVRAVAHVGRTISAHLRTALEEQQPECCIEGCHVDRHLEIDHNIPVSEYGPSALWNLNRLCHFHHDHKHAHKLRLEGRGTGKYFVSAVGGRGPSPPDGRSPPERGTRRQPALV